ncbi:hypothetical protein [Edaphocola aurantiacus]|nr:hypothetical protein [Edaphocola aurantiacus]
MNAKKGIQTGIIKYFKKTIKCILCIGGFHAKNVPITAIKKEKCEDQLAL